MYFYIDENNQVVMYSEGHSQTKFKEVQLEPSQEEMIQIESNLYDIFIVDGELDLQLNDRGEEDKKKKDLEKTIDKIKNGTNTKKELADLLTKLIK